MLVMLKHFKTNTPKKNNFEMKKGASIKTFFVHFCQFHCHHNLADHFSDLAAEMFPDSAIVKKFHSKWTKTSYYKNCLAATEPVIKLCKKIPFSTMVDKLNDNKTDKGLVVQYVGPRTGLLDIH